LARNTPVKKPNRGEGIISPKPRPKSGWLAGWLAGISGTGSYYQLTEFVYVIKTGCGSGDTE